MNYLHRALLIMLSILIAMGVITWVTRAFPLTAEFRSFLIGIGACLAVIALLISISAVIRFIREDQ